MRTSPLTNGFRQSRNRSIQREAERRPMVEAGEGRQMELSLERNAVRFASAHLLLMIIKSGLTIAADSICVFSFSSFIPPKLRRTCYSEKTKGCRHVVKNEAGRRTREGGWERQEMRSGEKTKGQRQRLLSLVRSLSVATFALNLRATPITKEIDDPSLSKKIKNTQQRYV